MGNLSHLNRKQKILLALIVISPLVTVLLSLFVGRYSVTGVDVWNALVSLFTGDNGSTQAITRSVIIDLRLPRALLGLLVGASLAVSGATLQGMFKNPLIDAGMLGVSSGASFGAVLAILLIGNNFYVILAFAFIFGVVAAFMSYGIGSIYKGKNTIMLVLGGVIVTSLFSSLVQLGKYVADPFDTLPTITFWLMGSLANKGFSDLVLVVVPIIVGLVILILMRWHINVLSMGDKEATSLGMNVQKSRLVMIGVCTLVTAASVSVSGTIGWVGLIIPHIIRMVFGNDNRILIPASMALGATFLLLIDDVARTVSSSEIPIGVLTALIGAPFYIVLLKRTKGGGW